MTTEHVNLSEVNAEVLKSIDTLCQQKKYNEAMTYLNELITFNQKSHASTTLQTETVNKLEKKLSILQKLTNTTSDKKDDKKNIATVSHSSENEKYLTLLNSPSVKFLKNIHKKIKVPKQHLQVVYAYCEQLVKTIDLDKSSEEVLCLYLHRVVDLSVYYHKAIDNAHERVSRIINLHILNYEINKRRIPTKTVSDNSPQHIVCEEGIVISDLYSHRNQINEAINLLISTIEYIKKNDISSMKNERIKTLNEKLDSILKSALIQCHGEGSFEMLMPSLDIQSSNLHDLIQQLSPDRPISYKHFCLYFLRHDAEEALKNTTLYKENFLHVIKKCEEMELLCQEGKIKIEIDDLIIADRNLTNVHKEKLDKIKLSRFTRRLYSITKATHDILVSLFFNDKKDITSLTEKLYHLQKSLLYRKLEIQAAKAGRLEAPSCNFEELEKKIENCKAYLNQVTKEQHFKAEQKKAEVKKINDDKELKEFEIKSQKRKEEKSLVKSNTLLQNAIHKTGRIKQQALDAIEEAKLARQHLEKALNEAKIAEEKAQAAKLLASKAKENALKIKTSLFETQAKLQATLKADAEIKMAIDKIKHEAKNTLGIDLDVYRQQEAFQSIFKLATRICYQYDTQLVSTTEEQKQEYKNPFSEHELTHKIELFKQNLINTFKDEKGSLDSLEGKELLKIISNLDKLKEKSKITLDQVTLDLIKKLKSKGAKFAFVVGNRVRDSILGTSPSRTKRKKINHNKNMAYSDIDLDITCDLSLSEIQRAVPNNEVRPAFILDEKDSKTMQAIELFTLCDYKGQKLAQIVNSHYFKNEIYSNGSSFNSSDLLRLEALSRDYLTSALYADENGIYIPLMGSLLSLVTCQIQLINKKALYHAQGKEFQDENWQTITLREDPRRIIRGLSKLIRYRNFQLNPECKHAMEQTLKYLLPESKNSYNKHDINLVRMLNISLNSKVLCLEPNEVISHFVLFDQFNILDQLFPDFVKLNEYQKKAKTILLRECTIESIFAAFFLEEYANEFHSLLRNNSLPFINLHESLKQELKQLVLKLSDRNPLYRICFNDYPAKVKALQSKKVPIHLEIKDSSEFILDIIVNQYHYLKQQLSTTKNLTTVGYFAQPVQQPVNHLYKTNPNCLSY